MTSLTDPPTDNERLARLSLALAIEPGQHRYGRLVGSVGASTVVAALRAGSSPFDRSGAVRDRLRTIDPVRVLDKAAGSGLRFICPGDREWPRSLEWLSVVEPRDSVGEMPFGLWLRGPGDLAELLEQSIAVVGARAATDYGMHLTAELSADLGDAGWTVVSGAAYGIDAAGHRGILAVGGVTIAVLACGADVAYPRGNSSLIERIAETGVVVSECQPQTPPSRGRFLARNRLIAAMTRGTVVVEAAVRSGALNTANWAADLHRPLMAVPGPVTSSLSHGCHQLIREVGAELVTNATDVIAAVSAIGDHLIAPRRGPTRPWDGLSAELKTVLESLPARCPRTVDEIAAMAGVAPAECQDALDRLGNAGLAERVVGGWQIGPAVRDVIRATRDRGA